MRILGSVADYVAREDAAAFDTSLVGERERKREGETRKTGTARIILWRDLEIR